MSKTISIQPQSHRKLIDIPEDVFKTLSINAAAVGMNLKKFIEKILADKAADLMDMDDTQAYRYLIATKPEGKIMMAAEEQVEFERRHGIGEHQ